MDAKGSDGRQKLAQDLAARKHLERIDYVILNAGISKYPNVGLASRAANFLMLK